MKILKPESSKHNAIVLFFKKFYEFSDSNCIEVPSFSQIYTSDWSSLISESHNFVEIEKSTFNHSEIVCIQKAQYELKNKFLYHYNLLTLLEPCSMCAGAIIQSRIHSVTYFIEQKKIPGISNFSPEFILNSNHFPKLEFLENHEVKTTFNSFFKKIRGQKETKQP